MQLKTSKKAVFITLTYNDDNCPLSVSKRHCQLFFKRLRRDFPHDVLKYYLSSEYGHKTMRPHYHLILFGLDSDDLCVKDHRSSVLDRIWPYGFNFVGDVTPSSCGYVSRYTLKKSMSQDVVLDVAKSIGLESEFSLMSKGLGLEYFHEHKDFIISNDGAFYFNGIRYRISRYFLDKLKQEDEDEFNRLHRLNLKRSYYTGSRYDDDLHEREKLFLSKISCLKRKI